MKVGKKLLLMILLICIICNYIPIYTFARLISSGTNSLHFIINHVHSAKLTNDGESNGIENGQDIVTIEGYIEKENGSYKLYIVDGDKKNEIKNGEKSDYSEYVESFDSETGKVTLKPNPLEINGKPFEHFTAFSISAGHEATKIEESQNVTISFLPYVHLVKMDAFYVNEYMTVVGSGQDEAVFGTTEQNNKEQDTVWVYTYIKEKDGHKVGEIVKKEDGETVYRGEELPDGLVEDEDVKLTKVYSTLRGLHTDKTVNKIEGEDRKFTIDLESWFAGAKSADIGLVLDASGSMVFTSDALEPININDKDLGLTKEQKNKLMEKALTKEKYGTDNKDNGATEDGNPSVNSWKHDIFLTQEEVNEILNTNNTDNNPLSDSGYNYYVFNEAEDVNEYAPLGYWDGSLNDELYDSLIGYYEFNKGSYENTKDTSRRDWLKNSVNGKEASVVKQIDSDKFNEKSDKVYFENADTPSDWSNDDRIKMNNKGLTVKNLQKDGKEIEGVGVLLDVKPTSNNFTISFTVEKSSGVTESSTQKDTDLIYIGPLGGIESSDYYRVYRASNSSKNRLKVKDNNSKDDVSINSVFNTSNKTCTITLVFENGNITSYLDGQKNNDVSSQQTVNLTDKNIVIGGVDNNYDGADLYIDNVCVFDEALSEKNVKRISFTATEAPKDEYLAYNTFKENKEKEEKIGYTDKYFVDPVTGGMSGWYYINHDSNLAKHYFMEKIETAKVLWGVNDAEKKEKVTYTDKIKIPKDVKVSHEDTEYTYTPDGDSPTLFYLDAEGNLCCFFTRGTKQEAARTSLVYKKDDSDYIKAEALQRAIGSFATELNETSPYSEVSAVRYSANDVDSEQYDKFVLLDWTSDPGNIQAMMSLKYGNGGTLEGTNSTPESEGDTTIKQYNYGITGGTATYVGLEAFKDKLSEGANPNADKYLVIFTDGKDTTPDDKKTKINETVDTLKEQGYTIMAVMLTGGTIEYSDDDGSEYQQAKKFLLGLVGTKDTTESDKKDDYFFSTAEVGNLNGNKVGNEESNIDVLTEIFTNELLERISDNLNGYSVQDYIDPRFDLVSATGREYKLDANGIVTILNTDGSVYARYNLKEGTAEKEPEGVGSILTNGGTNGVSYLTVTVSTDIDVDARQARLYFDNAKNLYYIKWVEQTIPGCVPEAKKLSVWNTRITVKAKDDFIGGNAVLTNGNDEKMNYVYSESDNDASSGTDDCLVEETDALPSKGFPRVTVNIPTPEMEEKASETIFMGENLSYSEIRKKMIEKLKEEKDDKLLMNYLEYLDRYEKVDNKEESYIGKLINGETVTIPYSYLPNADGSNLTGVDEHRGDVLGKLEYKMEVNDNLEDGTINDRKERVLTFTVTYKPETEEQRLEKYNNLVKEESYKWDKDYKPAVGDIQTDNAVINSEYTVGIVSGEIALQVVFNSDIVEILEGQNINYEVDLNKDGVKIGTFKAVFDDSKLEEKKEDGSLILTATLEYADGYKDYMDKDGLPLGNYTLGEQRITNDDAPSYLKFEQTNVVNDVARYLSDLFKVGTGYETPTGFLATFKDEKTITLGDKTSEGDYLQKRFGLFEVKPIAVFEMPEAGSNSLVILYISILACIIISIMIKYSAIPKIGRGKH